MNCSFCLRVNCGEKVNSQKKKPDAAHRYSSAKIIHVSAVVWHCSFLHYCRCSVWSIEICHSHSNVVHWRGLLFALLKVQFMMKSNPYIHCVTAPSWPVPPHFLGFMITLRHTTLGRTLLNKWAARRRDFYVTALNTHKRQDVHAPGGIRTCDPSKRVVADLLLRSRGRWDRRNPYTVDRKCMFSNGCRYDQVLLF